MSGCHSALMWIWLYLVAFPCCSGMLLWILTVFAQNKFIFFFAFCIIFPPAFFFPGPFFFIDSVRSSGQSAAQALERAWDQFPQNFKCSLGCQTGIICLQGYATDRADIFCFVIGVLAVRSHYKLEAKSAGSATHSLMWEKTSKNCIFAWKNTAFNLFALWFDVKIISKMWDYWKSHS